MLSSVILHVESCIFDMTKKMSGPEKKKKHNIDEEEDENEKQLYTYIHTHTRLNIL